MHKPEREQGIAKTALALMTECDVAATPENFELFYAYASGETPSIAPVLGALIAARKPFTPEILLDLRMRCLSSARAARAMDSFGNGLNDVIGTVLGKLEDAGLYARDPAGFDALMKRLDAARLTLTAAEEEWLTLEALRESLA